MQKNAYYRIHDARIVRVHQCFRGHDLIIDTQMLIKRPENCKYHTSFKDAKIALCEQYVLEIEALENRIERVTKRLKTAQNLKETSNEH